MADVSLQISLQAALYFLAESDRALSDLDFESYNAHQILLEHTLSDITAQCSGAPRPEWP